MCTLMAIYLNPISTKSGCLNSTNNAIRIMVSEFGKYQLLVQNKTSRKEVCAYD